MIANDILLTKPIAGSNSSVVLKRPTEIKTFPCNLHIRAKTRESY